MFVATCLAADLIESVQLVFFFFFLLSFGLLSEHTWVIYVQFDRRGGREKKKP